VDSSGEFTFRRNWFRRIALRSATSVIVETLSLSARAARDWGLATDRLRAVLPTFDLTAYEVSARPDQVPGLIKREEELWLGADVSAALPDDLAVLVEGFAQMPAEWQLVLIGNVPARDALQEMAERLELSHRIQLPGVVADAPEAFALLDAYVAPPCGQAFPTGTAKAMAAGKAVCAAAGDESARLLAQENAAFLSASFKPAKLGEAIEKIADDPLGRAKAGQANRLLAESLFGGESKAAALDAVYGGIFAS
jgi:glycosyltransferase involved in cell wall biosynthesis